MSEESLPDILPEADTWQLTMVGKIFLGALALSVLDRPTGYQVRGTLKEIEAVKDAVLSSKKFRCELTEPNATVESVIALLASKKDATQNFENILGVPWPM
tara:strand:- start:189 stop:491 length:303 start_codon:yes stop_codon:yes gene_type:complete